MTSPNATGNLTGLMPSAQLKPATPPGTKGGSGCTSYAAGATIPLPSSSMWWTESAELSAAPARRQLRHGERRVGSGGVQPFDAVARPGGEGLHLQADHIGDRRRHRHLINMLADAEKDYGAVQGHGQLPDRQSER